MDATEVTEVCRLCPATTANTKLISVFDERFSGKNNMKEVILVTTGIEMLKNDLISVKICDRCSNITMKMFKFRQDAIIRDRALREKCSQLLEHKGIRLPNTNITIKQERREFSSHSNDIPSTSKKDLKVHNSITQLYEAYPTLKLPKACMDKDMTPYVSLPMGDVEKYFKKRKLSMKHYISKTKTSDNNFAKKRTSLLEKKTVAPLKISKKIWEHHKQSLQTGDSYFCTPVTKQKSRKRSTSSGDSDIKIKLMKDSIAGASNNATERSATPLNVTIPLIRQITPVVDQSEDSTDSVATNISTAASSSSSHNETSRSEFLESFGLTSAVTTTKSQTQLVCNLCGSVHNTSSELKRHTNKHMVCQFCKRRFKSLENKQHHIDNICEVKKIMNSSGPTVNLMRIDLNLEIRKKYKESFVTFEPIPGLVEPEEVVVRASSPPQQLNQDNIIVLSDEDDDNADPLSGTPDVIVPPVNGIHYPKPETNSSIVRPDVKIKNDDIISEVFTNNNEFEVMKNLLRRTQGIKHSVHKILQTDLPANKDIKIIPDGTCEFKNLKELMLPYTVPINISNGSFNVGYHFENKRPTKNKMGRWNVLPLVDVKRKDPTVASKSQPTILNSRLSLSSSAPIHPNVYLAVSNSESSSTQTTIGQNCNSPTPLFQTFCNTVPTAAVPNKKVPIPKTYFNRSVNNNSGHRSSQSFNNRTYISGTPIAIPTTTLPTSTTVSSNFQVHPALPLINQISSANNLSVTVNNSSNSMLLNNSTSINNTVAAYSRVSSTLVSNNPILPTDIVSQKICRRCYRNVRKIHEIVQSAIRHDQDLKEKCQQCIENKGLRLPNTCITIKKDNRMANQEENERNEDFTIKPKTELCSSFINNLENIQENQITQNKKKISPAKKKKGPRTIHPSIIDVFRKYPHFKLPKRCLDRHMAPIVSFSMGEVETYFKKQKLDMSKYIYRPRRINAKRIPSDSDNQPSTSNQSPNSKRSMLTRTSAANEIVINQEDKKETKNSDDVLNVDESLAPKKRKLLALKDPSLKIKKISVETPLNSTVTFDQLLANTSLDQITCTQNDSLNSSKPDFVESLGLTPAKVEAASQNSLTCQICNIIHTNISALKKHSSRHRICPYCKFKFKSVEIMQKHVEQNCSVRKIPESPEQAGLKKNDNNIDVRQKYKEALSTLEKGSKDCLIVFSDIEEAPVSTKPADESIYRPIVSIYNDITVDDLKNELSDVKVIRDIVKILRNDSVDLEDDIQTPQPCNDDIVIHNDKARLKNLRNYLTTYMIPITLNNNEEFHVCFNKTLGEPKKEDNNFNNWDDIPLIEKRIKTPTSQEIPLLNALTFVTSQVQSLMMTTPAMSFILPNGSTFIPNTGISIQNNSPAQTIFSNAIQTTPLLQNYTLSMTPVPIIQTGSSSKTEDSVEATSSLTPINAESSSVSSTSRKSLPASVSVTKQVSVGKRRRSTPGVKRSGKRKSHRKSRQIIKVKIGNLSKSPKKVRVKNLWEK